MICAELMKIWNRANLRTQNETAVIMRIERNFSGYGLPVAIGRQTFMGEHRSEMKEAEAGEEIKRSKEMLGTPSWVAAAHMSAVELVAAVVGGSGSRQWRRWRCWWQRHDGGASVVLRWRSGARQWAKCTFVSLELPLRPLFDMKECSLHSKIIFNQFLMFQR